jgi:glycosyltransferase involved in cell wall biosynthesis
MLNTFAALDRRRYRPLLAAREEGPFTRKARALGVPVFILPMGKARWRRPWEAVPAVLSLARIAKEQGADLLHANCYPANKLAGPAAWMAGVPCLWHKHILAKEPGSSTAWLWRFFAKADSRVIGVSSKVVASLVKMGLPEEKVSLLYNGVDVPALAKVRPLDLAAWRRLGLAANGPLVGAVGMRRTHKGMDVYLEACRLVARQMPRTRFVLVGDPAHAEEEQERRIAQAAGSPELAARLKIFLHQESVARWMKRLDLLVSPSRWEVGAPLVVLEAMACGVPVVATEPSSGEAITSGVDGLLTPAEDPAALAEGILKLLRHPGLGRKMAWRARSTAARRFSLERYSRDLMTLYDRVIEAGSKEASHGSR